MDPFSDTYLPWFILKEIPDLGNILYKQLLDRFFSPENVLIAPARQLERIPGIPPRVVKEIPRYKKYMGKAQSELDQVYRHGVKIVTMTQEAYPSLLKEIHDPPPFLTYTGTLDAKAPCISIVGSRTPTAYGLNTAKNLSFSMASAGFQVVSGMARGIDTAAHKGALKAGGKTIAVLGSGLNRIYPKENLPLFSDIQNTGAVISEFKLNCDPYPQNFPIRNRIIAGLSTGTLVVEAAQRSGSLITARLAGEYNREVFAVPGSIQSKKSRGTHFLLKQGAKLVENEMDILDELHQFVHVHPLVQTVPQGKKTKKNPPFMDKELGLVYKHLDPYPKHIDLIIESTRMDTGLVSANLLDLELKGLVLRHPGNYFSLSEE
ncbi:MAG: DNA-processing protein DprA [Proteobacteria bacterium]|nr:DNA-processing protein DprA [Pseudomonadota bacterium]